jgi:branched-chain amino acid transport system ATP-binding protein
MTLRVQGLGIDFGGIKAVQGLDLAVEGGEIVGLIGPNGAGKTTAFNLITGIYRPTAGTVELGGQRLTGLKPHQVTRRGVARTFQNIRLFRNLPVLENVRVACHVNAGYGLASAVLRGRRYDREEARLGREARELLELMGLGARADDLAGTLSYGDQRRLEIARALATGPKLLLLDEPAAGMNMQERTKLMELIRFLRDRLQLGVLLIEHDMRVVMGVCERVTVLDHGEPIATGTPEAIQRDPAVIEAYLGKPEDAQPLRSRARRAPSEEGG